MIQYKSKHIAVDSGEGHKSPQGSPLNLSPSDRGAPVGQWEPFVRWRTLVWRKSILDAVEEVENALYSIKKYESAVSNSRNLVRYDAQSLEFSRELVQRQDITLLELIETERNAAIGREAHARNLRRLALEFVALNVALGSGYAVGMTNDLNLN